MTQALTDAVSSVVVLAVLVLVYFIVFYEK
jgi:hypothetical protein